MLTLCKLPKHFASLSNDSAAAPGLPKPELLSSPGAGDLLLSSASLVSMSLSPKARLFLTIGIPFGAQLVHFLWGKASLLGLDGKEVTALNNEKCVAIPGELDEQKEQKWKLS